MKFYPKNKLSARGKIYKELDARMFKILKKERGAVCEIHNKACPKLGQMHILSKGAHPRLRYCKENIILAGWFCSHFYTHHNPDDKRSVYTKQRIIEIMGEDYIEQLLKLEVIQPKQTMTFLNILLIVFRQEVE